MKNWQELADLQDVQLQRAVCRAASEPYHVPDRRSL